MAVEYEFVFLTPVETDQEEFEQVSSKLEKQIKSMDGKVKDKNKWGRKDLAYDIQGNDQAVFRIWVLEFPEKTVFSSLKTFLNRNEKIIRYLLLNKS